MKTSSSKVAPSIAILLLFGGLASMMSLFSALNSSVVSAMSGGALGADNPSAQSTKYATPTFTAVESATPTGTAVKNATSTFTVEPTTAVPTGYPREDYTRIVVLLPPQAGVDYAVAVMANTWNEHRYTLSGSADDSGIGNLTQRRVIAINPAWWTDPLEPWFENNYPGVEFVNVTASTSQEIGTQLGNLSLGDPPPYTVNPHGQPRVDYGRVYILIPPKRDSTWAVAAAQATWATCRSTIGNSADDAGIGALSHRRVVAINPGEWIQNASDLDLSDWYQKYYPGVDYVPVTATVPNDLFAILPSKCLQ